MTSNFQRVLFFFVTPNAYSSLWWTVFLSISKSLGVTVFGRVTKSIRTHSPELGQQTASARVNLTGSKIDTLTFGLFKQTSSRSNVSSLNARPHNRLPFTSTHTQSPSSFFRLVQIFRCGNPFASSSLYILGSSSHRSRNTPQRFACKWKHVSLLFIAFFIFNLLHLPLLCPPQRIEIGLCCKMLYLY